MQNNAIVFTCFMFWKTFKNKMRSLFQKELNLNDFVLTYNMIILTDLTHILKKSLVLQFLRVQQFFTKSLRTVK